MDTIQNTNTITNETPAARGMICSKVIGVLPRLNSVSQ